MTFLVLLFGLLTERFYDWSHLRRFDWYRTYQAWVNKQWSMPNPATMLALYVLPITFGVFLISLMIHNALFGFLSFVLGLAVFIYCLGPKNLWAQAVPQAITYPLDQLFLNANQRIFAVVFWFLLLGPAGAILYRLVALNAGQDNLESRADAAVTARSLLGLLDWIPIRLFSAGLALGGHFSQVMAVWRSKASLGPDQNDVMLVECGYAALGNEVVGGPTGAVVDKQAIGLLDRALIITLVVLAMISLIV